MMKKSGVIASGLLILFLLFLVACSEQDQNLANATAEPEAAAPAEDTPVAETTVKGLGQQKPAVGNGITGMAVAPATTVLPASSPAEQETTKQDVVFDVTDMTYNPYTLRGFTYTLTNHLDRDIEATLDVSVEGEEEGTRLRVKKLDLVRVKPGESKTVNRDLNANLVKIGVPQTVYFSIYEYGATKGPVLATDDYNLVYS